MYACSYPFSFSFFGFWGQGVKFMKILPCSYPFSFSNFACRAVILFLIYFYWRSDL
jgi:hypothetical protein